MLEKEIEKILKDEVKKAGGKAYKWTSPGNDGVPDRIVIFPDSIPIFVELKTGIGKLSKVQKAQIRRLKELGQQVEVVRGVTGLIAFFAFYGRQEVAERLKEKYMP